MGKIESICISKNKGEKKTPVDSANFIVDHGLENDAHAGSWHRQVSILALEDVETTKASGLPNLTSGDFAENIVTSDINLNQLGLGSRIKLGNNVELFVSQLGKTCHTPCTIYHQTGDCIMPKLGIFARVTKDGIANAGDSVEITETVSRDIYQTVIITVSDRCSTGETEDTAGPAVAELLKKNIPAHIYKHETIPDDQNQIAERLSHYCNGHSIDLILTVGGTGFAPRDVTPEAVSSVIERPTPGLDEAMRMESLKKTPNAILSRSVSGIKESTLIISLPGSLRSSTENLEAILPALEHGLSKLRGDPADCGR